jgi:hypothetical protein
MRCAGSCRRRFSFPTTPYKSKSPPIAGFPVRSGIPLETSLISNRIPEYPPADWRTILRAFPKSLRVPPVTTGGPGFWSEDIGATGTVLVRNALVHQLTSCLTAAVGRRITFRDRLLSRSGQHSSESAPKGRVYMRPLLPSCQ